jgi:hypothetical protein
MEEIKKIEVEIEEYTFLYLKVLSPYYGDTAQIIGMAIREFVEKHRPELQVNPVNKKLKILEDVLSDKEANKFENEI